ncbi:hypothetical protein AAV94_00070 [Lampropedia cohaerens]|uniref:Uncharacterized protein n=1 Tax=Lampropedia cohaerens TaxID=1610491 RepID=A0A0U1Q3P5_9BURK|nr:hypothetical protein AAV94_00070 [Lampropedia cohaerens]
MALVGPLLAIVRSGALMTVSTGVLSQPLVQSGSPPPLTLAVLLTVVPLTLASGVTLMVKLAVAPAASPAAMSQLTSWPEIVQPAALLIVSPAGTLSLTVAVAVVAAVPLLVTVMV